LVQVSIRLVEAEKIAEVRPAAEERAVNRIVDIMQPMQSPASRRRDGEGQEPPDLTRAIRQKLGSLGTMGPTETPRSGETPVPSATDEAADEEKRKDAAR